MMQSKKLGKMKMPSGRGSEMDLSSLEGPESDSEADPMEGSQEEEAGESPEMEKSEQEAGTEGKLESVSDEDLMAELKKRGLLSKLGHGDGESMPGTSDQDMYS